jgi:hypothetical protein
MRATGRASLRHKLLISAAIAVLPALGMAGVGGTGHAVVSGVGGTGHAVISGVGGTGHSVSGVGGTGHSVSGVGGTG